MRQKNNMVTYFFRTIFVAFLFFLLAKIGLAAAFIQSNVTIFWLPSGLSIATILIFGSKNWLGISLGAFFANYSSETPIGFVLATVIANTIEPLFSKYILISKFDFDRSLFKLRDVVLFLFVAVFLSPILSAMIGTFGLCLNGMLEWGKFFEVAFSWWAGDAFGILTLGSLILVWLPWTPFKIDRKKLLEGSICILIFSIIQLIIYFDLYPNLHFKYLTWFIFPVLIWVSIRFNFRIAIAFAFIIISISVLGTVHHHGPFFTGITSSSLILLYSFVSVVMINTLVLAAVTTEKAAKEIKIENLYYEQQQANQSLQKKEEQLRLALDGGDLGLWDWHFLTGHLEVNDRWMTMLGLDPNGHRPTIELWTSLIHPEDTVKLETIIKEDVIYPSGKNFEAEIRARHKDGYYIWILDKGAVVERDNAGNPIRISGTHIDITKSKQSQEILHLREKSLGAISQGVLLTDSDRRITYINKAFENITGYKESEILGISCKFLQGLETDKNTLEKIRIAVENHIPIQTEIINYRKDGSKFWNELAISPVFDSNGKLIQFVGVQRDITEQKNAKLELINAKEEAEAANKTKSDFLNNMSHEIRTPLNAVIGYTDLLLKSNLDETQTQYLNRVTSAANSLLDLLNDILDFSNIESGKIVIQSIPINLRQLLEQILNEIKLQSNKKNILVSFHIANDFPQFIISDPVKLKKIIANLISNAFKFTEEGEIEIEIKVNSYIPEENKVIILFSVKDTGIGISKEDQSKIFAAFSQVDTSTSRKFGGTGLGLSISNQLLKLLHSKIEVKSELGKGSEFYFYLTAKIESPSFNQTGISKDNITSPLNNINFVNPYKILVVDDDIINLELIKTIIKSILPNVILLDAANGKSAVEEYINKKPNLIFLDIQMPEMSGYEAATKIRNLEDNKHIPIIAITAGIETGNKEKCFKSGMNDYANKPVTKIIIEQLLQKWLQRKNEMY